MAKKKFAVYPRTKAITREGLTTGKGHRRFNVNKSLMNITDPAEAKEIDDKYGLNGSQDVYVVEDGLYAHAKDGEVWDVKGAQVKTLHHYTFGQVGLNLPARKDVVNKTKVINGQKYIYALRDGKIRLEPIPTRKRTGAREGAEVHNAIT